MTTDWSALDYYGTWLVTHAVSCTDLPYPAPECGCGWTATTALPPPGEEM